MKKLLLFTSILTLILTGCSSDNSTETDAIVQAMAKKQAAAVTGELTDPTNPITGKIIPVCWRTCTAHYDNVGTFLNPRWNFIVDAPQTIAAGSAFKIVLEIQATDGEDITTGIGGIISITDDVIYNNVSVVPPAIARTPAQLLQWYRWRIRIYGIDIKDNSTTCRQTTPWYDNPLG